MGHDDVYLWNNRIMKEKDVDKYLDKICASNEKISPKKAIIILTICFSLSAVLGVGFYVKKIKKTDELSKPAKTEKYQTKNIDNTMNTIAFGNVLARNR